ncbi:carbamoyltransferase [Amycolatopsis sp. NPDC052450]|uniref:carbamoyltransferase n=1 Tax=Amycolatopsis sp. NPDC052450 TaxID=3363937 RepID=UPI0037C92577
MIVLGISGLPRAQEYLRAENPNLSSLDARVCQGLDSAACLVVDGEVVAAAAEERFSGEKGTGKLPVNAIDYCLRAAGIGYEQVDAIAHGFDYDRYRRVFARTPEYFEKALSGRTVVDALTEAGWAGVEERFHPVDHHLAHATSAFMPSGFSSALCVVSDGMGETEALSVYTATASGIEKVYSQSIGASLGLLYSICTRFLGFAFNSDEYKVMGLAAYGDKSVHRGFFDEWVRFDPSTGGVRVEWPRGALTGAEQGYPSAMEFLETSGVTRRGESDELTEAHENFAAALQAKLTEVLVALVSHWLDKTGETSLCLAGGTFLNCKANQSICDLPQVERAFVQPASSDDGTSLGAALHVSRQQGFGYIAKTAEFDPYTGPGYTADEVRRELERVAGTGAIEWKYVGLTDEYFDAAAADLAADRIIAWFHGRMEFGPRALGNRSILGLPSGHRIKERINGLVKFREPFRPFAPAVLDTDCAALFETKGLGPTGYMLCTAGVRPENRDSVAGIVHADGSARVQVVKRDFNEKFHRLLSEVKRHTGFGCVVNTSFNVKGQPLIMAPGTAVDTFVATSLDRLYIEGFVACKTSKP